MATIQAAPFNIVALMAFPEDPNGGLDTTGSGYYVSKPTKWDASNDITDGAEYEKTDGDGGVCCNATGCDTVKGASGSVELCKFDPLFTGLVTGTTVFTNGAGDADGYALPHGTLECDQTFAVETWQRVCIGGRRGPGFLRRLWSGVTFTPNDGALEEDFQTIAFNWKTRGGPLYLGGRNGILNDWSGLPSALGGVWYDPSTSLPAYPTDELIPVASLPA